MEALPLLIFAGIVLTIATTCTNYYLYVNVFEKNDFNKFTYITYKTWFRALFVPFIYVPGLNVIGLLILLYLRAMKALDIN